MFTQVSAYKFPARRDLGEARCVSGIAEANEPSWPAIPPICLDFGVGGSTNEQVRAARERSARRTVRRKQKYFRMLALSSQKVA